MADWYQQRIVETGRLPLFFFLLALVAGFAFIRFSVRMIRAQVRWWPGNVTPGGLHVHHVVFGVAFMVAGGIAGLVVPPQNRVLTATAAAVLGLGTALVLDEFALILHLRDVYWTEEGRTSVDAVFVAIAVTALLVLGIFPVGLVDGQPITTAEGQVNRVATGLSVGIGALITTVLAGITVLKGKLVTGLLGLFVPILLVVGAIRLARPGSPWARWRYRPPRRRKLDRAVRRDQRLRQPVVRARIRLQNAVAGRPDGPASG